MLIRLYEEVSNEVTEMHVIQPDISVYRLCTAPECSSKPPNLGKPRIFLPNQDPRFNSRSLEQRLVNPTNPNPRFDPRFNQTGSRNLGSTLDFPRWPPSGVRGHNKGKAFSPTSTLSRSDSDTDLMPSARSRMLITQRNAPGFASCTSKPTLKPHSGVEVASVGVHHEV